MKAIISVYDKIGVSKFARELTELGVEIISSGGTHTLLEEEGIKALQVSDITDFQECLDGRVKTLHPKIHGGILANRNIKAHMETLKELAIPEIDIVVVNLYPFAQVIGREDHTLQEAIENIDIGGPTMIRAAAKNHEHVLVVTDINDYDEIIARLKEDRLDYDFRLKLAQKAFATTAQYDIMIANYLEEKLGKKDQPDTILMALNKTGDLRYGENPHQSAAYYSQQGSKIKGIESGEVLHGKELSYNNYGDTQGAIDLAMEFDEIICVAVKHATPCGVATGSSVYEAYTKAYESDPKSIFGGIVALNRKVDKATAEEMHKIFLEVVVAPDFDEDALEVLKQKKNLRLIRLPQLGQGRTEKHVEYKTIGGGLLAQDINTELFKGENKVVTEKTPTAAELKDLEFAMTVVKHVKSNAIVVVKDGVTQGIGGGEVNRIWAAEAALNRAGDKAKGGVIASDAYFPFDDVVKAAEKKGIAAIIQPGGSINDQKSIDACNQAGISMVFTDMRHFRH